MYGSNGAMKHAGTCSVTTLTGTGNVTTSTHIQQQSGNWYHPAGPFGFRLSTPARARLYCQAK